MFGAWPELLTLSAGKQPPIKTPVNEITGNNLSDS